MLKCTNQLYRTKSCGNILPLTQQKNVQNEVNNINIVKISATQGPKSVQTNQNSTDQKNQTQNCNGYIPSFGEPNHTGNKRLYLQELGKRLYCFMFILLFNTLTENNSFLLNHFVDKYQSFILRTTNR